LQLHLLARLVDLLDAVTLGVADQSLVGRGRLDSSRTVKSEPHQLGRRDRCSSRLGLRVVDALKGLREAGRARATESRGQVVLQAG
jgi:hypothetical protein